MAEQEHASRLIPGGTSGRSFVRAVTREVPGPRRWDPFLVERRLIEAFGVLDQLPMNTRPRGHSNSMPRYVHDAADLQAQREMFDLKLHARNAAIEKLALDRNRVRVMPTAADISRADEALAWPMAYLRDKPEVSRAVCLGALWALFNTDVRKACARLKIGRRSFYRRKGHGLHIIAIGLERAGVAAVPPFYDDET